jgi:hypothetical protein
MQTLTLRECSLTLSMIHRQHMRYNNTTQST